MLIPVTALVPGMILAKDLYEKSGILLLNKDTCLTSDAIFKIKNRYLTEVDIIEPSSAQREEQEAVLAPQIAAAHDRVVGITASIMSDADNIADVDPNLLKGMVGDLKSQIDLNTNVLLNLSHIKTHDNYLFSHVVNVCVIALILGREMNLSQNELRELGVSALLHDGGMVLIPLETYNKEGPLAAEEWQEIKMHPEYGCNLLATSGNFSETVLRGIREHHERLDGSGYPRGLSGAELHLFSRIIAVADVYDACISARKYRKRMPPRQALQNVLGQGGRFAPEVLRAIVAAMAVYPIGSFLRLNTGEVAKVVGIQRGEPFRPEVLILFDRSGNPLEKKVRINLADDAFVQMHVAASIEGEALEEILRKMGEE